MRRATEHPSARGLTLVEVLVAMTITLGLLAAVMTIAFSSRRLYEIDQQRTGLNQNLRAGMDLLGAEVRQAGERLPGDVPAIQIADGAPGPDTLTVRRNLTDIVLPVCVDVPSGSTGDFVIIGDVPAETGCQAVADSDSDGWPDNLQTWREMRIAGGGNLRAFIYNPATRQGEFFDYDDENAGAFRLGRGDSGAWQYNYLVADQSRVYLLEESVFRLDGDVLQRVINDGASPLNLVNEISNFQVRAILDDGSIQTALAPSDPWQDLRSLEITMVGTAEIRDKELHRVLTTQFFPRNVLSR